MVVASVSVAPHMNLHLFLVVSVHFILSLCDKLPDIWKSIEKVVRRRRTTLKSGTALAVPAAPDIYIYIYTCIYI